MARHLSGPSDDLGRATEPDRHGLPQLPISRSSGVADSIIRPRPSAGALAPEPTLVATPHPVLLPPGSDESDITTRHTWRDQLPYQEKAGLCVISKTDLPAETSEDIAIVADRFQAFVVHSLQNHVEFTGKLILENSQPATIMQDLLHRYCDAVRDLDYMKDKLQTPCKTSELSLMKRTQRNLWVFVYALSGGSTLLLPALVMALAGGRLCALITTSVCTVLFAALMAWGCVSRNLLVVFNVAMAYSAALVILMSGMM